MGEGESVTTERLEEVHVSKWQRKKEGASAPYPFHIMKAVERIRPGSGACQSRGHAAGLAAAEPYQS